MASITVQRHVNAPIDRVFDLASDFASAPGRVRGIKKVEMLTPGPVGVGTRFRETRIMFKKEASETMEVLAFDRPRSYTLGATNCGCEYRTTFRFTPAAGGTDVAFHFEARPLTFMARILGFLFAFMIKACAKEVEKDLADIAAAAEGTTPAPVAARS